jgi:hypothetical protein
VRKQKIMKFKMNFSFVIFFLLFMVSCNSQHIAAPTPTLTIQPTIANSPKPTATIKPTITNSPKPTATINSIVTPSPTLSSAQETEAAIHTRVAGIMQTQKYYMLTEMPATFEARNVKCKDGFVLEQGIEILQVSNDQWTLFTCSPLPKNIDDRWTPGVVDYGKRYTQITKNDLSQTWIIQHNTFDYSIIDRPDALLFPYRWTADGKYLYLFPTYYPGKSGLSQSGNLYTHISSLYRINLETGDFELVLRRDQFGALELSPDDQFLAYSEQDNPDIIHIKNMESSNDFQVKINEDIIASGVFVWNPESTKVVFAVGYEKQSEDWQDDLSGISIFVLTLKYMHAQKVLAKDPRLFIPTECSDDNYWLDENTMCLLSINQELDSWNKIFTINIETGMVTYLRPWP